MCTPIGNAVWLCGTRTSDYAHRDVHVVMCMRLCKSICAQRQEGVYHVPLRSLASASDCR